MARIAGVNIPTNKRVLIALQYIHGIGQKNAAEIIDGLTLYANRVRQAAITNEIIEVVSGAQSLEG